MKYTIDWMEEKVSAKGSKYYKATLKDETDKEIHDVAIFSSFGEVLPGSIVEGVLRASEYQGKTSYVLEKGNLGAKPASFGGGIAKAQAAKAEYIKEAQQRKEDSIAYFNAINNAIAYLATKNEPFGLEEVFTIQEKLLERYESYNK